MLLSAERMCLLVSSAVDNLTETVNLIGRRALRIAHRAIGRHGRGPVNDVGNHGTATSGRFRIEFIG